MSCSSQSVIAGDTFKVIRDYPDYPSPAWTLTINMVMEGNKLSVTATDNGDGKHLILEDTSGWAAGFYSTQERVTDGAEVYTVNTGTLEVKPDFSQSTGEDARSHVKKVLDALEAMIEGRATKDQQSYSIANRSISKMTMEELLSFYDYYKRQYAQIEAEECAAKGFSTGRRILVRMP